MKEEIDKLNQADSLVFQTEKQLKEYGDKVPADKKEGIEKAAADLKEAHQKKDLEAIDTHMATLNQLWQEASQDMYKDSEAQGGAQADPNAAQQKTGADDEVTDVDFEEVK